ncbi:hypothetical protein quinque_005815 [Culex quinquefasciatus]
MKFLTILALIAVTLGAVLAANTAAVNGKSAAARGLKALNATKIAEISQKVKTLKLKYPNFTRNSVAPKVAKVAKN